MTRLMSRAKRMEAVTEISRKMYEAFERWYDEHPDAAFEEIEEEGRRLRRQMMGPLFEVLINGRDTGTMVELPRCGQCGRKLPQDARFCAHCGAQAGGTGQSGT